MKRLSIVFIFAVGVLLSTILLDLSQVFKELNIQTYGNYSYVHNSEVAVGDMFITKNNRLGIFDFGDYLYIDKTEFDINRFIDKYELEIVSIDNIELDGVILYVLYCDNLPKYRLNRGKKYNIQIAISKNGVKLGYPAIFDSF